MAFVRLKRWRFGSMQSRYTRRAFGLGPVAWIEYYDHLRPPRGGRQVRRAMLRRLAQRLLKEVPW